MTSDLEVAAALERFCHKHVPASQKEKRQIRGLELDEREARVITLIFEGMPQTEIAAKLGISIELEKHLMKQIYRKAGVSSVVALVARAWRQGGFIW